jgi:hypothetical protein
LRFRATELTVGLLCPVTGVAVGCERTTAGTAIRSQGFGAGTRRRGGIRHGESHGDAAIRDRHPLKSASFGAGGR